MKPLVRFQLSLMMFLEFFIWGGWFVTLGTFLGNNLEASGAQSAMAFSTQSWGAIIAPCIIGLIADKFFNEQHVKFTRTYSSSDFLAHIKVLENEPLVSHMSQWLQQNQVDKQN